ncbi:hypothetical protein HaLaN_21876, partial [Haematococcus lacustris]
QSLTSQVSRNAQGCMNNTILTFTATGLLDHLFTSTLAGNGAATLWTACMCCKAEAIQAKVCRPRAAALLSCSLVSGSQATTASAPQQCPNILTFSKLPRDSAPSSAGDRNLIHTCLQ